ncbi:hypothetical protein SAMN04488034_102569 [Salinimicrobium catena]|uniref:Glyoxalase n=1 Tax=Salinimicrobium catena TaxID=390640 RepID=A0A1H5M5L4_9FLAO|nr:glyoxalase [Salinimicrobium catena]SDL18848.1 hypothetical protein SAMN04488140_102569 [Salinimicrobium catena]SEE84582.1 hypothetical protein SAMN04488034_102569 [Salinimicrobium catena]
MKKRDQQLLEMRPEVPGAHAGSNQQPDSLFQNNTLRPVVKLQNDLLVEAFRNYLEKHKVDFAEISVEKRLKVIENAIQKDMKFRNSLKGMIIGQFTIEEYRQYITNSSALNKRMMHLVTERLKSNIQLFDPLSAV